MLAGLRLEEVGSRYSWRDLESFIIYGLRTKNTPLGMCENNRSFDDRDEIEWRTLDTLRLIARQNTGKRGKLDPTPRHKWVEDTIKERRREKTRVVPKMQAMTEEQFFAAIKQANENLQLASAGEIKITREEPGDDYQSLEGGKL